MLPIKWKIYRIISYVQLSYAFLFFLWFIWIWISTPRTSEQPLFSYLAGLLFFLMFVNPVINIILVTKNFPDKTFSGNQHTLYVISIIANILTGVGLILSTVAGFVSEFDRNNYSEDNTGKILLAILSLITIVNLFLLLCQFGLARFLRKNSRVSLSSLVDSIGNSGSESNSD